MNAEQIQTQRLSLVPYQPKELLVEIQAMDPAEAKEISPQWLERLRGAVKPDPWTFGFELRELITGQAVGMAGFKGPPDGYGVVEVAYGIKPAHRQKGYATEATEALLVFAFNSGKVRSVIAHTLPQRSASTRVLTKCGFAFVGDVVDPEDGPVWRWEKTRLG